MIDQDVLLKRCLALIEQKMDWPDSSGWRNSHFEELAQEIWEETRIQLSAMTLKRVWGKVQYHSLPSPNTLDTLAQFIGYKNWIDFEKCEGEKKMEDKIPTDNPSVSFPLKRILIPALLAVSLVLLSYMLWPNEVEQKPKAPQIDSSGVSFEFEPLTTGIPNTVIFRYNAAHTQADSVFIQQSWDPRLRNRVAKDQDYFASTYYYPGFFQAKLILNDKIVLEKDLHIPSNGWMGTLDKDPVPVYLKREEMLSDSSLGIRKKHLLDAGFDLLESIPFTEMHFVKDFEDLSASNFRFETEFRHSLKEGEAICQKGRVHLICSRGPIIMPFSIKGCVSELELILPGELLEGSTSDLSGFGQEVSRWTRMEIEMKDSQLEVWMNGEKVFTHKLIRDPGQIAGIRYQFHGTGEVRDLKLESEGKVYYEGSLK
ncbi:MAG: hypothetical protein AAGD28_23765 [Bacteroidota bacterium]